MSNINNKLLLTSNCLIYSLKLRKLKNAHGSFSTTVIIMIADS